MFPTTFQHHHIHQGCWKNPRTAFQCIIVVQSRGQCPKNMENHGTNLSPTFNDNQDLVPWIGEQQYIKMLVRNFPKDPDICGYVRKFAREIFEWMFIFTSRGQDSNQ